MERIKIVSRIRSYEAQFISDMKILNRLCDEKHNLFIIDENVWKLYSNNVLLKIKNANFFLVTACEQNKSLETAKNVFNYLLDNRANRNSKIVCVGGGMLQDVVGFVASAFYRGIIWDFFPTTLISQSDSCIGGKTSLNYRRFKNILGSFYPPSNVYIYLPFIQTLSHMDFISGIGEIVKLHILGGRKKLNWIEKNYQRIFDKEEDSIYLAVRNSLQIKSKYINKDEFDKGIRILLNYGHTFGHSLETVTNYSTPHGYAVMLGILYSNILSRDRNLLSPAIVEEISRKLILPILKNINFKFSFERKRIVDGMEKDKKRTTEYLSDVFLLSDFKFQLVNNISKDEASVAITKLIDLNYLPQNSVTESIRE